VRTDRGRGHDLFSAVGTGNPTRSLGRIGGLQEHHDDEADDPQHQTQEEPSRRLSLGGTDERSEQRTHEPNDALYRHVSPLSASALSEGSADAHPRRGTHL
jgi:hypothetical protein